jgi:hypothetical protein
MKQFVLFVVVVFVLVSCGVGQKYVAHKRKRN